MGKEEFKAFVAKHPILIKYVRNNTTSWQQLYETYSLYGEKEEAWKDYLEEEKKPGPEVAASKGKDSNIVDGISNFIKNMDMKQVQSGIGSIQKVLGLVSDLFIKNGDSVDTNVGSSTYIPRAVNRKFDD